MSITYRQLIDLWGNPFSSGYVEVNQSVGRVCTDSRLVEQGSFFVPIIGNKFDGHDYLGQAAHGGAKAAVIANKYKSSIPKNLIYWLVDDTLVAYQQLARLHRLALGIPVVAVTGSVGKTTTRELIRSMLASLGSVTSSEGNNNNDIGVPLTLLKARSYDVGVVVEMGMRGLGEIRRLCRCTCPDIAVITNIGHAHVGLLGSRKNIAIAKCEVTSYLKPSGTVVIPAGDELLEEQLSNVWNGKVLRVAIDNNSFSTRENLSNDAYPSKPHSVDFFGSYDIQKNLIEINGENFSLPLEGKHNALNFMLAIAVAQELGISFEKIHDLKVQMPSGRNTSVKIAQISILDETYNASPESVKASLELLSTKSGRHFAVLGTMLELGDKSLELHSSIMSIALNLELDGVIIVSNTPEGEEMAALGSHLPFCKVVPTPEDALPYLQDLLLPGDTVLLKGSRQIGLDRLLPLLESVLK